MMNDKTLQCPDNNPMKLEEGMYGWVEKENGNPELWMRYPDSEHPTLIGGKIVEELEKEVARLKSDIKNLVYERNLYRDMVLFYASSIAVIEMGFDVDFSKLNITSARRYCADGNITENAKNFGKK